VFGNAGQDCCARSRAIVHKKVYEKLVSMFFERTKKLRVGDPMDPKTEVGPLVSEARRKAVAEYVRIGRDEGAQLVCGGTAPNGKLSSGAYLLPAVFDRAKPEMRVFQEEIFGPVLVVTPFSDEEEAVRLANATIYGLSGSIWTRDIGRALRVARRVQSGNLSVNSASSVFLEAPFGGVKQSGLGRELGMKALEGYSETRNVFLSDK
jgi:betaine-aldehyde dehydrogenase